MDGSATFGGSGNCECGCPGKPPCNTSADAELNNLTAATGEYIHSIAITAEDLIGNYLVLPVVKTFFPHKLAKALRSELDKAGIDVSELSDREVEDIFELTKVNGEM